MNGRRIVVVCLICAIRLVDPHLQNGPYVSRLDTDHPENHVHEGDRHTLSGAGYRVAIGRKRTFQPLPRMSVIGGWSQPIDATLYLKGKRWSVW